jgi:hypothetical protein
MSRSATGALKITSCSSLSVRPAKAFFHSVGVDGNHDCEGGMTLVEEAGVADGSRPCECDCLPFVVVITVVGVEVVVDRYGCGGGLAHSYKEEMMTKGAIKNKFVIQ